MSALPTAMSRPERPVVRAVAPNRLFHATALLIALWLGVASPVRASNNEPLVLAAAVQAALARSQALNAQDAAARSAREAAVAAGQRPDPVLRFSLNSLPIEGDNRFSTSAEPMTSKAVSLMQAFPAELKRQARSQRFEREADVALATRAQRAASLRRDTAIAWFERHAQEQRVSLLRALLSENRLQLQAAEAATRGALPAGANSPSVDWLNARDAVTQAQQALLGAEAGLVNARQALARWTGTTPDQPLGDAPALTSLALSANGFAPQLQQHPDLALASARLATAEADAELARQDRQPDWSGELMFSHRRPRFDNMVSLAVSVPLQWDRPQRQDRVLAARLARVDEVQADREERAREALAETERWLAGSFDANPPPIGQRLVSLREEIRKHPETVAAAEGTQAVDADVAGNRGRAAEHCRSRQRLDDWAGAKKNILQPHRRQCWVIPPKANRKEPRPCDFALYCERNLVERFFNKIKHYRAVAPLNDWITAEVVD